MTIRRADPNDWEDIQRLNREIFDYELANCEPSSNVEYPYQEAGIEYFKQAVNNENGYTAFLYEQDQEIVGYMILKVIPDQELAHRNDISLVQLHTISVSESHRGKGIGTQLINKSKEWARECGANRLKVVAYAKNDYARALYRKCGFEEFEIGYEVKI